VPRSEEITDIATLEPAEQTEAVDPPAPPEPEPDAGESVRVIGARRPRRTGEGKPAEPAPGTAAIGARHIEAGQTHRSSMEAWITRVLAFAALSVVIVALLLVLKPF
jgi:hypothetical protein